MQRLHTLNNIFLASQPSPADFEQAKNGGIRTVINLRHEDETKDFNERDVIKRLGLNYYNPAFSGPAELTDHIFDRTRELLRDAERPILLHCSSANRVGAIWLAYRVLDNGLSVDQALTEARTVGLKSPAYEQIARDYIKRMRSK